MTIPELLQDPSIIKNDEGNILCVKVKTNREHHLKPEMVINEARMTNEGWMVKRKPVANGNGKFENVYLQSENNEIQIPLNKFNATQEEKPFVIPEKIPIFGLSETEDEILKALGATKDKHPAFTPVSSSITLDEFSSKVDMLEGQERQQFVIDTYKALGFEAKEGVNFLGTMHSEIIKKLTPAESKTKKKGGRPVGSKNKKPSANRKPKTKVNS